MLKGGLIMRLFSASILVLLLGLMPTFVTADDTRNSCTNRAYHIEQEQNAHAEHVECHTPLFYRTMFIESEKPYGIFMGCDGPALAPCSIVLDQLATLTNSDTCKDNFFISLVEASEYEGRSLRPQILYQSFWLVFAFKSERGDIYSLNVTFPEGTTAIDCLLPMFTLMAESFAVN
jgi:hypothetical protein